MKGNSQAELPKLFLAIERPTHNYQKFFLCPPLIFFQGSLCPVIPPQSNPEYKYKV